MARPGILAVLVCLSLLQGSRSEDVKMKYDAVVSLLKKKGGQDAIPVRADDEQPVKVSVKLTLVDILNVDKENNKVESLVWLYTTWTDPRLTWDSTDENTNVSITRLSGPSIWRPDLSFYNSLGKAELTNPDIVAVSSDGSVLWVPGYRVQFWCDLQDVDKSSGAECYIIVGSWTHHGDTLTLVPPGGDAFNLKFYHQNPRYSILKTGAEREVKHYPCCPEAYEDMKFSLTLRSREGAHSRSRPNFMSHGYFPSPHGHHWKFG